MFTDLSGYGYTADKEDLFNIRRELISPLKNITNVHHMSDVWDWNAGIIYLSQDFVVILPDKEISKTSLVLPLRTVMIFEEIRNAVEALYN
jgi:hypothetical protein